MLKGFCCPRDGEEPGRENEFHYCLTRCANRCMPKAMLAKFVQEHETNVHRGDMITPSGLKGCTRKMVLERTSDYYAEPNKLYYAVRGSLVHGFLENTGLNNVQTEVRLWKKLDIGGIELVISGQIDYYDADERVIEDYKTTSDKGTYFLFRDGAKPEHILQTNVYRWLCDGGHLGGLDGPQVFWPVDRIVVRYLFMNQVISTGRVHYERVNTYRNPNEGKRYGLETRRGKVGETQRGVPIWEIEIDIPGVPLMSEAEIVQHITDNGFQTLMGFKIQKEGGLPDGVLYDKEDAWQCSYCPCVKACHAYELATNPAIFKKFINVKSVK